MHLLWPMAAIVAVVLLLMHCSYRIYARGLREEKELVAESAALHLRTIEILATAIDAKFGPGDDRLKRVQAYALELGRLMRLAPEQLDALRAAALLHDIGKLGVPEHLFSKAGPLEREEFEKVKVHPVLGGDILTRVRFPYPVAPMVRSHHERWDGRGYPDGLRGGDIPVGARILSVADRLDTLTSQGCTLDEAMETIAAEAGCVFDPRVVEAMRRSRPALEQMVRMHCLPRPAPVSDAGHPVQPANAGCPDDFLGTIAAARQEVQALFDINKDLGNSLSLDETLSVFSTRLKRLVPHDCLVIYLPDGTPLLRTGGGGESHRSLSKLEIPLEGARGLVAVLTLYRTQADAFTGDHRRILLAVSTKVAVSIENTLKYRQAERSAVTDELTGLPNARSLFIRLDAELARCRRENTPLAVLVSDLDGFKAVNDCLGHLHGNKVLRSVAQGLKASCREYDYVARMGGDEFVLLLPGLDSQAVGARLLELSRIAAEVGRMECGCDHLAMSAGEAMFPEDGADAETLLALADRRMYQTKEHHRTHYRDTGRITAPLA